MQLQDSLVFPEEHFIAISFYRSCKELVDQKWKLLLSFIHLYVTTKLYDFYYFKTQADVWQEVQSALLHIVKVEDNQRLSNSKNNKKSTIKET